MHKIRTTPRKLAGLEAEWLMNLLEICQRWPKPVLPISLHCESHAANPRASNKAYNRNKRRNHGKTNLR